MWRSSEEKVAVDLHLVVLEEKVAVDLHLVVLVDQDGAHIVLMAQL